MMKQLHPNCEDTTKDMILNRLAEISPEPDDLIVEVRTMNGRTSITRRPMTQQERETL